jgi:formylglycine-generating enzyme required for sulfatase activity
VEQVSWHDAKAFCQRLSELPEEKKLGRVYRLPTEAEWEYACRGGATSRDECSYDFYLAKPTNDLSSKDANINGQLPGGRAPTGEYLRRPTRVGAYPSNKLGLCDMHGNVGQWCADLAGDTHRVYRGGHFHFGGDGCRAGLSNNSLTMSHTVVIGFRLARVSVQKQ